MTTVTVFRAPDGAIRAFSAQGHTGYADAGEDIVCAAVSALTQTVANGLSNVLLAPVAVQVSEKDALLSVELLDGADSRQEWGAQLLFRTLVEGLLSTESAYPGFLRVIFKEWRKKQCSK